MDHFFSLTPKMAPWLIAMLQEERRIADLVKAEGSPLFVGCTTPFYETVQHFRHSLAANVDRYQIYFARKPNHCLQFVRAAVESGIGVDCASEREMRETYEIDQSAKVVFTAAIKTASAVDLALLGNADIVLDNYDEINLVENRARHLGVRAKVALRFSGFPGPNGDIINSRFGFVFNERLDVLECLKSRDLFVLKGLHFHIDGYSIEERAFGLSAMIDLACEAKDRGFAQIDFIDIGGGFLVNYLEYQEQWLAFNRALAEAVEERRPPITYRNNPLHLQNVGGRSHRVGNLYPYFSSTSKHRVLDAVLEKSIEGVPLARKLNELELELRIEPGRSLLDQCGCTVARVAYRKRDPTGQVLIGLEMNFTQLRSSSAEFTLDPHVIYSHGSCDGEPADVVFVGAYCMEQDVILKRIIRLPQMPSVGDLVCFANTAGYLSHFFATIGHLSASPRNVFFNEEQGSFSLDDYRL